jgi:hypothetical protein
MSKYNGWTNYETWCVNLWLGNDQGSDEYWRETAQEIWNEAETEHSFTRDERATLDLADRLKDEIEENNPITEAMLYSDLLSAAISEVNWYEIAEHFIYDVDKVWEESDDYDEAIDDPDGFLSRAQAHLDTLYHGEIILRLEAFDTLAHARAEVSSGSLESPCANCGRTPQTCNCSGVQRG